VDKLEKKTLYFIAIVAIAVVVIASVGTVMLYQGQNPTPTPSPSSTSSPSASPTSSPASSPNPSDLPITLTDNMNHTVTLTAYPERIVSLAPANTQILFAVGAGDKVIGVTDYCKYPYNFTAWIEAGNMTSIGKYYAPAIEPIIALHPDLIVAAQGSADQAVQLADLGYTVLTLYPTDLNGVLDSILLVGRATNHTADATALVNSLNQRIDAVANSLTNVTTKPKVYVEVYSSPYTSVGGGTFIDGLIKIAGGQNIFENETIGYPKISSEAIISLNPDMIVFPTSMGVDLAGSFEAVAARDGWSSITAVKNNAMYIVVSEALTQPGPRLVDALEALAQIIHPEIFGNYTYQP
jgi:iron complex transport system substrate-binding protein